MDYLYLVLQVLALQFFPFQWHFFPLNGQSLVNEALSVQLNDGHGPQVLFLKL
jgi:hypothetical protein